MKISQEAYTAFVKHVLEQYPKEAVGVIKDGAYLPLENIHENPEQEFRVDPLALAGVGAFEAVLHSHPYNASSRLPDRYAKFEWPTSHDMKSWIAFGVPFGIVSTDGAGVSPIFWMDDNDRPVLVGRDFEHGTADCYAVIRDWFWQERKLALKNYPRSWRWWEQSHDLYREYFEDAGFVKISPSDAGLGDCIVYKIGGSPVPNHAAVVLENDMILHHVIGHKSAYDMRARWKRFEAFVVRYMPE